MKNIEDFHEYATQSRSGKIGTKADKRDFFKEINYIAKLWDIPVYKVNILEDTVDGELWIYIDEQWHGDLDPWFYECMDNNASLDVFLNHDWDIET